MVSIEQLIARHTLVSDQIEPRELAVILRCLDRALDRTDDGAVVELGCYVGTTSLFLRRLLDERGSDRVFHVYDSFAGLPAKSVADRSPAGEQFTTGQLAASKKDFISNFKRAGLTLPTIHKAWFFELSERDVPDRISFAFLDGDYYQSIKASLELVWPRLEPGAVVVVDDYQNEALPGAAKAVDNWLASHPARLDIEKSLAITTS